MPGVERERNQVFKMLLNSHSVKAAMSEKVQEVFFNGESNGDSPSFQFIVSVYFKCTNAQPKVSGYVNYNVGMEPEVRKCELWMDG